MLYNKDWNKSKTKPDVFSLESLIAWLETMPANKSYSYMCEDGACLLERYFISAGFKNIVVGGTYFWHSEATLTSLPDSFSDLAVEKPHTFGAALSRARASLQKGAE